MADRQDAPGQADLATQLTDKVEQFVHVVRDRATKPILLAARILVIGGIITAAGAVAVALLLVGLVRLFDVDVFGGRVWATYFLFGTVFSLAGLSLLAKSNLKGSDDVN